MFIRNGDKVIVESPGHALHEKVGEVLLVQLHKNRVAVLIDGEQRIVSPKMLRKIQ